MFTCHEHVWRMFQDIKVDTRRIPNRHGEMEAEPEEPQPEVLPEPVPVPAITFVEPQPEPVAPEPEPEPIPEPVKVKSQPKPRKVEVEPEPIYEEPEEVVYEAPHRVRVAAAAQRSRILVGHTLNQRHQRRASSRRRRSDNGLAPRARNSPALVSAIAPQLNATRTDRNADCRSSDVANHLAQSPSRK